MKKEFLFISGIVASFSISAMTITLSPGQLEGEMAKIANSRDSRLELVGRATSYDLTLLNRLPAHITSLDMSGLIVEGCRLNDSQEWYGATLYADGEIPSYMLTATGVKSVALPANTKIIGRGAFAATPLEKISLKGLDLIGESLFYGCGKLEEVKFDDCGFREIPSYTFSGCSNLTSLSLPEGIERVGERAFEKTSLTSLSLPLVKEAGDYAFAFMSRLDEVNLSNDCLLGEGAFFGDGALSVISENPINIPPLYMYAAGGSDRLVVSSSIVGEGAYVGHPAEYLDLGMEVSEIHADAFRGMPHLSKVNATACGSVPDTDENAFSNVDVEGVSLYVSPGDAGRWQSHPVWGRFNIIDDPADVASVTTEGEIRVTKEGDSIIIYSGGEAMEVSVYSLRGLALAAVSSASEVVKIGWPDEEEAVVVKATAGAAMKIIKIMK